MTGEGYGPALEEAVQPFEGIYLEIHASAIVDFYHLDGSHRRDLYRIYKHVKYEAESEPKLLKVWLTDDRQRPISTWDSPPSCWKTEVFDAFRNDVAERIAESGGFADIQERWFRGLPTRHYQIIQSQTIYPLRYVWDGIKWRLDPAHSQLSWLSIDEALSQKLHDTFEEPSEIPSGTIEKPPENDQGELKDGRNL